MSPSAGHARPSARGLQESGSGAWVAGATMNVPCAVAKTAWQGAFDKGLMKRNTLTGGEYKAKGIDSSVQPQQVNAQEMGQPVATAVKRSHGSLNCQIHLQWRHDDPQQR